MWRIAVRIEAHPPRDLGRASILHEDLKITHTVECKECRLHLERRAVKPERFRLQALEDQAECPTNILELVRLR